MQNILEDALSNSSSPIVDLWDSTENRKLLQILASRYQCGQKNHERSQGLRTRV